MDGTGKPPAFDGKVAVITGSVRGIGRAAAIAFAEEGASVVINGRRFPPMPRARSRARSRDAGGRALVHLADVSDPDQAAGLIAAAADAFGRLDILVNNVSHRIRETGRGDQLRRMARRAGEHARCRVRLHQGGGAPHQGGRRRVDRQYRRGFRPCRG